MKSKGKLSRWLMPLIILLLLIVARLVSTALPRLIWTWIEIILFLCITVCLLLFPKTAKDRSETDSKKKMDINSLLFLFALILIFSDSQYYTYIEGQFPFLLASLILGIPIGAGLSILKSKDRKDIKSILLFLALYGTLSVLVVNVLLMHLNYTLDLQPPEEYSAIVEDKQHTRRRKGDDTYKFEITVDGQTIRQEVPSNEFHAYEIGDSYTVQKYGGAFGEAFYLPKP